jgi:hypothetical protein
MMCENRIAQIEKILKYCVLGLLALFALATLFIFVINWETWFFGIKLEGLPAGIALGATWLTAALLAAAFVLFPRMNRLLGGLTVVYFGFLFVNSSMTIQRVSYSHQGFSPVLAAFLFIAIAYLIVTVIKGHLDKIS